MPCHPEIEPSLTLLAARATAGWLARYHRASVEGLRHLPPGPALLVGNHGLFGMDTPVLFYLLWKLTGRCVFGLTDRRFFGFTPMRQLLRRVGGVLGTPANALALLRAGALVVVYPGGAREVFKSPRARYRLAWQNAYGFARVAMRAGAPVVPFAGLGVDDTYLALGHPPLSHRLLGKYAIPAAIGLGPLPLPVQLRFRLGPPLRPPRLGRAGQGEEYPPGLSAFRGRVQRAVEALLGGE